MKRFALIFLFSCIFPFLSQGQLRNLPKECKAAKPYYTARKNSWENLLNYSRNGYGQSEGRFGYWDVYSDRENNTTYETNSSSRPYSSLGFKEKVRIAQIKNDYALVYSLGDSEAGFFPFIQRDVVWKGWIPMSHLVYNDWSLIGPEGLFINVLLADNVIFDSHLKLSGELYLQPDDTGIGLELPNHPNSLFYMIKRDKGYVLLATQPEIDNPDSIYGWVSESDVLLWDSRMALESTSDLSGMLSIDENGHCELPDMAGFSSEEQTTMRDGTWRFPILGMSDNLTAECAVSGRSVFLDSPSQRVPITTQNNVSQSDAPRVNLYFVVDGSRMYEPFFPILAERIQALGARNSDNSLKVGMAIYHDARSGSTRIESFPLTHPDNPLFFDFIDQGGTYGFKDNLSDAPLMEALLESIEKAGFGVNDNNFLVVIGGRGDNSDNEISPRQIGERFGELGISIWGLQVQNNESVAAYRTFNYMMEDIMRSNILVRTGDVVHLERTYRGNGVVSSSFKPKGVDSSYPESLSSVSSGVMSEDSFALEIDSILQKIGDSVSSSSILSSTYPEFFRYVVFNEPEKTRRFFNEVALYSEPELDHLINLFSKMNDEYYRKVPNREVIVSSIIEALPEFLILQGETILAPYDKTAVNRIMGLGYLQVLSMIEGIRLNHYVYFGRTLREMESSKTVSDEELRFILSGLSRHYYHLLRVRNTPYIYTSTINGLPYYWVSLDDLL